MLLKSNSRPNLLWRIMENEVPKSFSGTIFLLELQEDHSEMAKFGEDTVNFFESICFPCGHLRR